MGVYTAGEGVDITNNVVTAAHPAMQSFESSFALILQGMPQALSVGFVSFMETGYVPGPTSVTVINAGKYLINYDATFEMQSCGGGGSLSIIDIGLQLMVLQFLVQKLLVFWMPRVSKREFIPFNISCFKCRGRGYYRG